MSYTIILIIITCIISVIAFSNDELKDRLILWPKRMDRPEEYYRFLSSGFIHADIMHLAVNMWVLYSFGSISEEWFAAIGMRFAYVVLYLLAIVVASVPSFMKHKNNAYYRSLGASGGVAAILFSSVYFNPWSGGIGLLFVPGITIKPIIFAILYLAYSAYMDRRGGTNINHGAHFWGSVFGFVFTLLVEPTHGQMFIQQIMQ
ncbi:MAG: rhomboid family intramembrane serine protease [Bacteroidetes bacterium]|nr:rhomboid family intramembrane serine protease [Bacteroidota bacterium]